MYIFVCVPVAGYVAPVIARNRVGPLPAHSPRAGGPVRARSAQLQRRGASCPCSTPAIQAGVQGRNRPVPGSDRSRPPSLAIGVASRVWEPSGPGGKRISYIFVELFTFLCCWCNYVNICMCTCHRRCRSRPRSEPSGTSSHTFSYC